MNSPVFVVDGGSVDGVCLENLPFQLEGSRPRCCLRCANCEASPNRKLSGILSSSERLCMTSSSRAQPLSSETQRPRITHNFMNLREAVSFLGRTGSSGDFLAGGAHNLTRSPLVGGQSPPYSNFADQQQLRRKAHGVALGLRIASWVYTH